ncbi:MAG: histidinol dehydrogenase [Bacteroidota bacterium]
MENLLEIIKNPERKEWEKILRRPRVNSYQIENEVLNILEQVKNYGDDSVRKFTLEFDGIWPDDFKVTAEELEASLKQVSDSFKKSVKTAIANIQRFHELQKITVKPVETTPGVKCWIKSVPIEKVGLYVPGGTAPLFSTLLMLGIPAKVAGCNEIVVCTPPDEEGNINPAILYCANILGITELYKVGGVQAIAAMAYGTESIPSVYKIFGPGNQYVTAAKQMVNQEGVAIDMPAGPSEVLVIADETAEPAFVASDLLSQAEHGADSQVILVTANEEIIQPVEEELSKQLPALPRKEIAKKALANSKAILLKDSEIMDLVNEYAPEHLIISTKNAEELAEKVINAGSVFLGNLSPESAGDYASGTNHTLPTYGFAKVYSGVTIDSFIKKISFQNISEYGLFNIAESVMEMAEIEQLEAHKNAVKIRMNKIMENKD